MYTRKAVVAGAFYPANRTELITLIDSYMQKVLDKPLDKNIFAVISPHAGYVYSGSIAAHAFNQLRGKDIDVAIVLAPSHRARFDGASVIPEGTYETPIDNVSIDSQIGKKLENAKRFQFISQVHEAEHSLEVQVPFLQTVAPGCSIVPIIIGTVEISVLQEIADSIYDAIKSEKRNIKIIISTDLSHYHPYEKAKTIDLHFIDKLKEYDYKTLSDVCNTGEAEACGVGPVIAGLLLCEKMGANTVDILHYANSGDTAGSKSQVVGYVSAAITG